MFIQYFRMKLKKDILAGDIMRLEIWVVRTRYDYKLFGSSGTFRSR